MGRARKAADFLLPPDMPVTQSPFVCCGMSEMTEAMPDGDRHVHNRFFRRNPDATSIEDSALFYQLEDSPEDGPDGKSTTSAGSNTLTYILGCSETGEAIIIDPVLEQVERDAAQLARMGLRPVLALNTHCHADHITSTGLLKARFPGLSPVSQPPRRRRLMSCWSQA